MTAPSRFEHLLELAEDREDVDSEQPADTEHKPNRAIIFVRTGGSADITGDSIFNNQVIRHLRTSSEIVDVRLEPCKPLKTLFYCFLTIAPPVYSRYISNANFDKILKAIKDRPRARLIYSHESLFWAWQRLRTKEGTLIFHNVHFGIKPMTILEILFQYLHRNHEIRLLKIISKTPTRVVALSCHDLRLLSNTKLLPKERISLARPGIPPESHPLRVRRLVREYVLLGSYKWFRKRRDLKWLHDLLLDLPSSRIITDLSTKFIPPKHKIVCPKSVDWSEGVRIGIVADRFVAGFKLKTLDYISKNCIVISASSLIEEFASISGSDKFVRSASDRRAFFEMLKSAHHMDLGEAEILRFEKFKENCCEIFTWTSAAASIEAMPLALSVNSRRTVTD